MNFYIVNLVALVIINVCMFYHDKRRGSIDHPLKALNEHLEKLEGVPSPDRIDALRTLRSNFLTVYALVVTADWLQGSFIYALYRGTHGLSESTVAALFTTGFLCGAISAAFVGSFADRYGRKKACLAYCIIYSLSCLTVFISDIRVLFFGRALGGVSTTLLFSVFETWLVTEMRKVAINDVENSLSNIFGTMATLNGAAAILSGVVSEVLVWYTSSNRAPFAASLVCLIAASEYMTRHWNENYGESSTADHRSRQDTNPESWSILKNTKIITLSLASCVFEGSMYVLVYFWSQAIIFARTAAGVSGSAPFGIIFASFMCALMMGSWLFKQITRSNRDDVVTNSSFAIQILLCVAASTLAMAVLSHRESVRFWAFCVFEFCIGLYLPSMASLKGSFIGDATRGKVYGLMRLPLNTFVVLALSTIGEDPVYRENRFMLCGALLLFSACMVRRYIN